MVWSLTQWEAFAKIVLAECRGHFALQAFFFPLCRIPFLVWGLLKSRILWLSLLFPSLLKGGRRGGASGCTLFLLPVGLPLLCPARGVEVLLDARPVRVGTSVSSSPSGTGVPGVSRSQRSPAACSAPSSVGSPSHHHALRGDELRESSKACSC